MLADGMRPMPSKGDNVKVSKRLKKQRRRKALETPGHILQPLLQGSTDVRLLKRIGETGTAFCLRSGPGFTEPRVVTEDQHKCCSLESPAAMAAVLIEGEHECSSPESPAAIAASPFVKNPYLLPSTYQMVEDSRGLFTSFVLDEIMEDFQASQPGKGGDSGAEEHANKIKAVDFTLVQSAAPIYVKRGQFQTRLTD